MNQPTLLSLTDFDEEETVMTERPGLTPELTQLRGAVMANAKGRCQCTGDACGRTHKKGNGRCHVEDNASHWLLVVPASDGNPPSTWTRVRDLRAMCVDCLSWKNARKRAEKANQVAGDQLGMFDLAG